MPTREQQRRVNGVVALFAVIFGGVMVFSYVMIAISEGMLVPKVELTADFRDAGSIGTDTEVQLAGKQIGKVTGIEFITQRYPCNPTTEDYGWPQHGRSDDCEPWMFCARTNPDDPSEGTCAALEEYSGHAANYEGCQGPSSCGEGQVCVTRAFRQRYRDVRWWGPAGGCVDFDVDSQRIRVTMEVDEASLKYIRTDSRASIVLNGILADPRVNITVGSGEAVEPGGRLQTTSSLMEDVLALKDEIDKLAEDIDRGLIGVSALTDSLSDEATKAHIEALGDNVREIMRQVEQAEGLVGAVLNDPQMRADLSKTMREVRDAANSAAADYEELVGQTERTIDDAKKAADKVTALAEGFDDPQNTSLAAVLVNDAHGVQANASSLADSAAETLGAGREAFADIEAALDEISRAIENREGSLGRIIADPKPLYHLKDPATMRRVNAVKGLVRWVIQQEDPPPADAAAEPTHE